VREREREREKEKVINVPIFSSWLKKNWLSTSQSWLTQKEEWKSI